MRKKGSRDLKPRRKGAGGKRKGCGRPRSGNTYLYVGVDRELISIYSRKGLRKIISDFLIKLPSVPSSEPIITPIIKPPKSIIKIAQKRKNKIMKVIEKRNEICRNIIVAFHIGRGGRFFNPGHLSFCGVKNIDYFIDNHLFLNEDRYLDSNGKFIISVKDVESGIGTLNFDGEYDTTYTKLLSDITDREKEAIIKGNNFNRIDILNILGIEIIEK
jgi:hypothetical protein